MDYESYEWDRGAFRQRELTITRVYDREYLQKAYGEIDNRVRALSRRRLAVLRAFTNGNGPLLDFGCGTGRFVEEALRAGWDTWGYDLIHPEQGQWPTWEKIAQRQWDVVTFFDSLEHLPDPAATITTLAPRLIMVSVPECHHPDDPGWFMSWKHRRPGEHLWHWNRDGLIQFMRPLGYECYMTSNFEDDFRERYDPRLPNILTAIFRRLSRSTRKEERNGTYTG